MRSLPQYTLVYTVSVINLPFSTLEQLSGSLTPSLVATALSGLPLAGSVTATALVLQSPSSAGTST